MEAAGDRRRWTLLTSHGHVLVEIARNPQARVRDISTIIGITERATQAIIADLESAGYVERVRKGRRTHYVLHTDLPFRHSAQDGLQVGPFLELLTGSILARGPGTEGLVPDVPVADDLVEDGLIAEGLVADGVAADGMAVDGVAVGNLILDGLIADGLAPGELAITATAPAAASAASLPAAELPDPIADMTEPPEFPLEEPSKG